MQQEDEAVAVNLLQRRSLIGTSQPALASIIGARRSAMDHVFGPSSRGIEGTWQTCHKGERDENRAPLNGLTFALTMHGAQPSYQRR